MGTWNSSPHPISDIRDWRDLGRLELKPDFQRREVWSNAAKIMLIDTIIANNPMPKIFLSAIIQEKKTHRIVIDGQQRIRAILDFLDNKFKLKAPYTGKFSDCSFDDLPEDIQEEILQYSIDFNEGKKFSDEELREIYSRVNKYTIALTKQELRRADFPGDFLDLSEELALDDFLESSHVFTTANRRRLGDVEYISEILAGLLDGPQEEKGTLDSFYQRYADWPDADKTATKKRFNAVVNDLKMIFPEEEYPLSKTRFRKKADFYSLFLAIDVFLINNYSINGKDISFLRKDIEMLNFNIEPTSHVRDMREYALRCVSSANSASSRTRRVEFLSSFLAGTYIEQPPSAEIGELFARIKDDLRCDGEGFCPDWSLECYKCDADITGEYLKDYYIVWPIDSDVFQFSNAAWVHSDCFDIDEFRKVLTLSDERQLSIIDFVKGKN